MGHRPRPARTGNSHRPGPGRRRAKNPPGGENHLPPRLQPAEKGVAAVALGGAAPAGRRRRTPINFRHRHRRARGILAHRFQTTGPGRGGVAADTGSGFVSRGAQTCHRVCFRRHRAVAFCRRRGRADPRPVWSHLAGALGADWHASPSAHRQPLLLWRKCGRLPERESLPGGDFARTGFGRLTTNREYSELFIAVQPDYFHRLNG